MNGSRGHHAKCNKPEKDKHCMESLLCGILKKTKQEEKERVKLEEKGTRMMVTRGCGNGEVSERVHTFNYKINKV